jgi:hypothetical protein
MASKATIKRQKSAEKVIAAGRTHKSKISQGDFFGPKAFRTRSSRDWGIPKAVGNRSSCLWVIPKAVGTWSEGVWALRNRFTTWSSRVWGIAFFDRLVPIPLRCDFY